MNKKRNTKTKWKQILGEKSRYYTYFMILVCCTIIALNIHPSNVEENDLNSPEERTMIYVFHDYNGNEYIMNDKTHGSSDSWDYLFNDEVPNDIKGEELSSSNSNYKKDTSMGNVGNKDINFGENDDYYTINEKTGLGDESSLIIEKIDNKVDETNNRDSELNMVESNNSETDTLSAKSFTFVEEGRVLPVLATRNDIFFDKIDQNIAYVKMNGNDLNSKGSKGITIIDDYDDCMTPWGYTILHGESVLAYQQIAETPNICNIERRFCWKGKLSGTYTQEGCSINKNYTYEELGVTKEETIKKDDGFRGGVRQNPDGTITVKDSGDLGRSITPNSIYTNFSESENIRDEEPSLEQTERYYPDCTTPRGEKVKHGQFVQAFKHANGFSDAPCESQIRLCSIGELMGTYTEARCKTRDTSFIDWVNGSPTWETYSKEKLELVKKQIKAEKNYYNNTHKDAERSTNSSALDKILYILDQD